MEPALGTERSKWKKQRVSCRPNVASAAAAESVNNSNLRNSLTRAQFDILKFVSSALGRSIISAIAQRRTAGPSNYPSTETCSNYALQTPTDSALPYSKRFTYMRFLQCSITHRIHQLNAKNRYFSSTIYKVNFACNESTII